MIYLFYDTKGVGHRVELKDILYIKAARSYCDIFLKDGVRFTTSIDMGSVLSTVKQAYLLRISRFEAINMNHLKSLRGNMVKLSSGSEHQITASYREFFDKKITLVKNKAKL